MGGGGLARGTENRALWARFRLDLHGRGQGGTRGVVWCGGWPGERAGGAGGQCTWEGGGLARDTENRALWARFRLDLHGRGRGRKRGVVWCGGWPSEQAGGGWSPVRVRGGRLAREAENRALWAQFRPDLHGRGQGRKRGLFGAGDGQVSGLGGLQASARERGAVWRANPKTEPCGLSFG